MRECSDATIKNRVLLLDKGYCYINNGYYVFKFNNSYYSSNLKRTKMYSMDDRYWNMFELSLINKLYLVFFKKVRKVK